MNAETPPDASNETFPAVVYLSATLYVPKGTKSQYKSSNCWKEFSIITELDTLGDDDNGGNNGGGNNDDVDFSNRFVIRYSHATDAEMFQVTIQQGQDYQCRITPPFGWKIHSLTMNGEDITSQLVTDMLPNSITINHYTLVVRNVNEDIFLNASYEQITSGIASSKIVDFKVFSTSGNICIVGNDICNECISIFDLEGRLVKQFSASSENVSVALPNNNIYIVKIADKVVKIHN